tara:strand:+ start:159 stop:443 length:285 start_codon:yes stop_codon:yes gene_type:complete
MKLSHLKNIIKESIKQLQNQKSLLTEGCIAIGPQSSYYECTCTGTGQNSTCQGSQTYYRYANCNESTTTDCRCCINNPIDPRGGGRAPIGPTIG